MLHKPEYGIGYLTYEEFERFEKAVNESARISTWLHVAGHINTSELDVKVQSSRIGYANLHETWLCGEEIDRLIQELQPYPTLEDAANDSWGQELARLLIREIDTAKHRWPMSEKPHRIRYMRCQTCHQQSLKYYPPQLDPDKREVLVKCTIDSCRAVMDHNMFSFAAALIEHENRTAKTA